MTGMPPAQLQSRLWSLEILDFLTESRFMSQPDFVFAHDLMREVAYDSSCARSVRCCTAGY